MPAGRSSRWRAPRAAARRRRRATSPSGCATAASTTVLTREPGGTPLGDEVRRIVLHMRGMSDDLDPRADALLYAAGRAQHVARVIRPGPRTRRLGRLRPVPRLVARLPGRRLRQRPGRDAAPPGLRHVRPAAGPHDPARRARRGRAGAHAAAFRVEPIRGHRGAGLLRGRAQRLPGGWLPPSRSASASSTAPARSRSRTRRSGGSWLRCWHNRPATRRAPPNEGADRR